MDKRKGRFGNTAIDVRDDYRNGFVDAILYTRGILNPSPQQEQEAVDLLGRFHAVKTLVAEAELADAEYARMTSSRAQHS